MKKCFCGHKKSQHGKYVDGGRNAKGSRYVCQKDGCCRWSYCDIKEGDKKEVMVKKNKIMSEDDMFVFFRTHCCNGTVDCENGPECPTEDGCLPQQLAEKLKGKMLKAT